ncbi:MAG: DUF1223 domain-containing protein [Pseudorhodoplanes sp.]|jgi:hypothetical protein
MRLDTFSSRLCIALAALSIALPVATEARADPRVLVELFTSQGCSSCPAADKLLGELAKDPSILTMSLSVDYWDYLGWKDTLALPGHARRQRAYAGSRGDRAVYTPQVVINGVSHVLGSDKGAIERAVKSVRSSGQHTPLAVQATVADGSIHVDVPAAKNSGHSGEVWLCPISKEVPVQVQRGENKGQTLTYTNVVRGWVKLGEWNGQARKFSKPLSEIKIAGDVDSFAVVVQGGKPESPGNVYGSAMVVSQASPSN